MSGGPSAETGRAEAPEGAVASAPDALRAYLPTGPSRGRTTEAVTDALREAVLDGVLPPSTWLREDELAHTFGVSRTPVREALRRLADEGLATKTANHGTVVAPLTLEDVLALYVVRENLEGLAARLAAARRPSGLVRRLDELNDDLRRSSERGELDQLSRKNLAWHRALHDGAANTYLERFLAQVTHAVRRQPGTTLEHPGRLDEVLAEHAAVARAIERGDQQRAEEAAVAHMHRARQIRLSVLLGA